MIETLVNITVKDTPLLNYSCLTKTVCVGDEHLKYYGFIEAGEKKKIYCGITVAGKKGN